MLFYLNFRGIILYSDQIRYLSFAEYTFTILLWKWGLPWWRSGKKNLPANAGDLGSIPESGRSSGEGNGNLPWPSCLEIPWTEEPDGLQSMGLPESETTRPRDSSSAAPTTIQVVFMWGQIWKPFILKPRFVSCHIKSFIRTLICFSQKSLGKTKGYFPQWPWPQEWCLVNSTHVLELPETEFESCL